MVVGDIIHKDNHIKKFLDTKPSVSEIIDFIEKEAQSRVKIIQETTVKKKETRFVIYAKTVMALEGDKINEWVRTSDNKLLVDTCNEIIAASKS